MTGKKGERLCPICDSPLEPGAKKCSFCGTDLSIFDTESEVPREEPEAEPVGPVEAAEEPAEKKLDEVFFGADEEEPVAAAPPAETVVEEKPEPEQVTPQPEPVVDEPEPEAEVVEPSPVEEVEPEVAEQPTEVEARVAEEHFECPECGGKVEVSAKSCPSCGVIFADEGADMFQCPACNTLVDVNARSCPGCGAIFVESEEEAAQERPPVVPAMPTPLAQTKVELEKPVSEVVIEPEVEPSEEAAEEESERKGLFGGLFGKKKRKKRGPEEEEEEEAEESRREFPSILRRGRSESEESEPVEEEEDEEEASFEPEPVVEEVPEREPAVMFTPEKEPEPERMAEVRPKPTPPPAAPSGKPMPTPPRDKTKGKELARLTAEIQPLMRLAIEKGIDVSKSRKLVDEGAMSVRARQMDDALESVRKARETLLESMTTGIEEMANDLKAEVKVAKALGGEVSRANTYLNELEKARKSGDFEAVYVYADKMRNELLPITGRYNESKQKISSLRNLVADAEVVNVNTKDARTLLAEAARAFETNDFDKVDLSVKSATDKLFRDIEPRMDEEIRRARDRLVELSERGQNITPMITVLKSARTLMKSKDYQQALKEMRDFKELVRKAQ
ncbi:TPA: hypothetical protein HA259_06685 [Thermoplasmata archaeon]|nr:hypothetical protein [Thermoplasmata archaeon]